MYFWPASGGLKIKYFELKNWKIIIAFFSDGRLYTFHRRQLHEFSNNNLDMDSEIDKKIDKNLDKNWELQKNSVFGGKVEAKFCFDQIRHLAFSRKTVSVVFRSFETCSI